MKIRRLPDTLINQIAAGEVVERPASVVKELVENALDADACTIEVIIRDGGRSAITIIDDGYGMDVQDLELSIERHATSKLSDNNLFDIQTLGFRGEALPSIASVSRMTITSRVRDSHEAWSLSVEGGVKDTPKPANHPEGTRIEIRDLFYATPARLKFLRSASSETTAIVETIQRLAMSYPHVGFSLSQDNNMLSHFSKNVLLNDDQILLYRLGQVMGRGFADNSLEIKIDHDDARLTGYISLPTLHRRNTALQYFFVNGRPVKDRLLQVALRIAYQDFLARDRFPLVALFLTVAPDEVDVNVHPAKLEVRFRNPDAIRQLLISTLKHVLSQIGFRASTTVADKILPTDTEPASPPTPITIAPFTRSSSTSSWPAAKPSAYVQTLMQLSPTPVHSTPPSSDFAAEAFNDLGRPTPQQAYYGHDNHALAKPDDTIIPPLGFARGQFHTTYVMAENAEGIVIVDQHAVHERLVYEKLKAEIKQSGIQRQILLVPAVIELSAAHCQKLMEVHHHLIPFGLVIESFGGNSILVREMPMLAKDINLKQLIQDLADEIIEFGQMLSLSEHINEICSTIACHSSIRAGHKLSLDEMNAMLRQMEATPYSGQCNHGRPTYVQLKKKDIEKLFGRR